MRQNQASSQLPSDVRNFGVTSRSRKSSPLMIISLHSPKETYDAIFLANYANNQPERPTHAHSLASPA